VIGFFTAGTVPLARIVTSRRPSFVPPSLWAAIVLSIAAIATPAPAQPFPSRTVRIVVPYQPGGAPDVIGRPLARELSTVWNQQVLIENVPGGDTTIGASRVATAVPDGHTLLLTTSTSVVGNRFMFKKLPYDPDRQLTPLTLLGRSGSFVLVHPSLPAKTLRELVTLARGAPGRVAYASLGRGSVAHLMFGAISKRENVSFHHVPFKGATPAMTSVISGEVSVFVVSPASTRAMVTSGKLRAIAITSPSRTRLFPEVPSVVEAGFPYVASWIWFGLFAPGGMSAQLVERIHQDATAILKRPEFVAKYLAESSVDAVAGTPAEFADTIRADVVSFGEMVKAANVQPE
jgi:tripartite-type tricarboxylate transporter receptor subunit TctC